MSLKEHTKEHAKTVGTKIVGGVVGLVTAGVVMWFTPLVDQFIKPAKPLANFESVEAADGLTVTFKNLSQNAKQAKWDFGDGSPLEVVPGEQSEIKHKFKKPNSYKVKLVVTNVVNQEDTRESLVAVGVKPQLLDLSVKALQSSGATIAPAAFRFEATADLEGSYEWDFGEGLYQEGKDIVQHTFNTPGKYLVRVRAIYGGQRSSPLSKEIEVLPRNGIVATGAVVSGNNRIGNSDLNRRPPSTQTAEVIIRTPSTLDNLSEAKSVLVNLKEKAQSGEVHRMIPASPGYLIKNVKIEKTSVKLSPQLINLGAETINNGVTIKVKAQVTKPGAEVSLQALVTYQEERNQAVPLESSCTLSLPGNGVLELPAGKKHEFEVRSKGVTIVKQSQLPTVPVNFTLAGRNFVISTIVSSTGQVNVVVREAPRQLKF